MFWEYIIIIITHYCKTDFAKSMLSLKHYNELSIVMSTLSLY